MRLYTLKIDGKEKLAVSLKKENQACLLKPLGYDFSDMNDLIYRMTARQKTELKRLSEEEKGLPSVDLSSVKICAPVIHPRQDMVCLGINYDEHAKEAGRFSEEAFGGQRPYTIYFSKRVSRLTGTGDPIPSYAGLVDSLDYEAELGVIIGKDARGVKARDAKDYIFGYTVVNDVSARICRHGINSGIWGKVWTDSHPQVRVSLPQMKSMTCRISVSGVSSTEKSVRTAIRNI